MTHDRFAQLAIEEEAWATRKFAKNVDRVWLEKATHDTAWKAMWPTVDEIEDDNSFRRIYRWRIQKWVKLTMSRNIERPRIHNSIELWSDELSTGEYDALANAEMSQFWTRAIEPFEGTDRLIVKLISQGLNPAEIARSMGVSRDSIQYRIVKHIRPILSQSLSDWRSK